MGTTKQVERWRVERSRLAEKDCAHALVALQDGDPSRALAALLLALVRIRPIVPDHDLDAMATQVKREQDRRKGEPVVEEVRQPGPGRRRDAEVLGLAASLGRVTAGDLVQKLGFGRGAANTRLSCLVKTGELFRSAYGVYVLPEGSR